MLKNVFKSTLLLVMSAICLTAANAAARMVTNDTATEARNNAYILNGIEFPNITQALPLAPSLQNMRFEKDFHRLTYLPAASIKEDVHAYMIHLIGEGYVLVPKMCGLGTLVQGMTMQLPDMVDDFFRSVIIEWTSETYTITLWLGPKLL